MEFIPGISQVSVLGPMLFKIFINHLEREMNSKLTIFFCLVKKIINKSNIKQKAKRTLKAKIKAKDDCDMLQKDFILLNEQLIKTVR